MGDAMDKDYDNINFVSKYFFCLRMPRVATFADMIKVAIMFIKTMFQNSIKIKSIRKYALKRNLYLHFLI